MTAAVLEPRIGHSIGIPCPNQHLTTTVTKRGISAGRVYQARLANWLIQQGVLAQVNMNHHSGLGLDFRAVRLDGVMRKK